jgi:hypothetical protein
MPTQAVSLRTLHVLLSAYPGAQALGLTSAAAVPPLLELVGARSRGKPSLCYGIMLPQLP